jgi:uncharacterized protein (TIGR02246 family)
MTSTTTTSRDVSDVKATLESVYQAWTDNDAQAFAEWYVEDATVALPGTYHQGKQAIAEYMSMGFAGPLKGSRGVDVPQSIRIIGAHTAIVVSRAGVLMAGEDELSSPERERMATWVLVKQAGRWLIAAYTNTPAH